MSSTTRSSSAAYHDDDDDDDLEHSSTSAAAEAEWLGQRVEVYWPSDETWFRGRIAKYDPHTNKYQVDYDDGESSFSLYIDHTYLSSLSR